MLSNRTLLILLFCLMGLSAGCSGDDDDDTMDAGNTATVAQDTSGGSESLGTFLIPAGTVVTSQSVTAPGGLSFSVGQVPASLLDSFTGVLLGSAAYMPLDCEFSRFVVISIPVGSATAAVNIYRYDGSAVSQAGGWQRLSTVNVRQGMADYEAISFGYYIAGLETQEVIEPEVPAVPTNLQASDGTYTDYIQVTWNPVFGGSSYLIYRDAQDNLVHTALGIYSWNDTEITDLDEHTYWVRASNTAGTSDYSEPDTGYLGEHDQGGGGDQ